MMTDEARRFPRELGARPPAFKRARYQQILDAALEILHDQEYEQIKVDDVARLAGLAKATLYRYFPSKDHLYAVVLRQWADQERQRPLPPSEPGTSRVRSRAEAAITAYERQPQFFKLDVTLYSSEEPEVRAELSAMRARTRQLDAGDFAAQGVSSPHDAAVMLQAILRSALTAAVSHGMPFGAVRRRIARFIDLYDPHGTPEPLHQPAAPVTSGVVDEPLAGFKQVRRDRILRTALEALTTQPYEQIHVSEIAQRSQLALGTLYRYFPSKEHLYALVIREWVLTSRFLLPFDELSPAERIRSRVSAALDAFEAHPQFFLLNSVLYFSADPAVHGILADVASLSGRLLADDFRLLGVTDPDEASAMLWATLNSLTQAALAYDTSFAEAHRLAGEFVTLTVESVRSAK